MSSNVKYKISVIVPIYNAEKYLEQCIQSIIDQTMDGIEIILVNDGSTDGSLKIAKEFEKKHDNIKVISQKNMGVIEARINGYKNTTGEYIGWVDADDFIEKEMYEKMYQKVIETNAEVAICNYKFYPYQPNKKVKWYNNYKGKVDYKFISRNSLQWNKIIKKELLEKVNLVNLLKKIGESAYTIVLINTDKIVTIDEELYNYRVGHSSLSTNYKNYKWYEENIIKAKNKLNMIKGTKLEEEWKEYFEYLVFYNLLLMLIIAINNNKKQLWKKYKKEIKNYEKNKYIKESLTKDYGKLKTFVLLEIIIKHYYLSIPIVKIFLRKNTI